MPARESSNSCRGLPCRYRFRHGVEPAEGYSSVIHLDIHLPSPPSLVPTNARNAALVVRLPCSVFHILAVRNVAQIRYPIIGGVPVNVVDALRGPCPVIYRPSRSMGRQFMPEKGSSHSSARCAMAKGWLPRMSTVPSGFLPRRSPTTVIRKKVERPRPPCQLTRKLVVFNQLAKDERGDNGPFSHGADSLHCGQGRALLTQRFRPAFSSRITVCSQGNGTWSP